MDNNDKQLSIQAEHLRKLRKAVPRLTQEKLSEEIGCGWASYRNWETGKYQPDSQSAAKLADYFGVSVDFILGRDEFTKIGNREICEITGLSDWSVNVLRDVKQPGVIYNQQYASAAINAILTSGFRGISLLATIAEYLQLTPKTEYSLNTKNEKLSINGLEIDADTYLTMEITRLLTEIKMGGYDNGKH